MQKKTKIQDSVEYYEICWTSFRNYHSVWKYSKDGSLQVVAELSISLNRNIIKKIVKLIAGGKSVKEY